MTATTSTSTAAWAPDEFSVSLDLDAALPDSFVSLMTTKAGSVEGDARSVRVPFVGADPAANVVAEGAAIGETDATLDEVEIATRKVAVLSIISNEQFAAPGASARLPKALQRAVTAKVNAEFVGILNGLTFTAGGTVAGAVDFDVFSDAIADVEGNGGDASAILMPSSVWKNLAALKTGSGSNLPILGVGDLSADKVRRSIFGVPVHLHNAATSVYVLSKNDLVSASSPLRVDRSSDYAFNRDAQALRSTLRFGVAPAHLNQHVEIALV
jgi:HK97 family phage major capsid protein